ncbi:MAG: UDP-N-acetylmuramate dehydrogenase [Treponema sp.]|nr:UDP-N-acetylmuramate dehydrogenase [Treponema sp.]
MYNLREIAENFKTGGTYTGTILLDEPIAPRTTFKVGGKAPLLIEPSNATSLLYALELLMQEEVPVFIFGGGSNLVVSDAGFEGAVIAMCGMHEIVVEELEEKTTGPLRTITVTCGAGTEIGALVDFCTGHAFSGLESFAGLPGTAGGAAYMNARCYNSSISEHVGRIEYIEGNVIKNSRFAESCWSYKKSPFTGTSRIITKVSFNLIQRSRRDIPEIEQKCKNYIADREKKGHFRYPCAGSIFKNDHAFGSPSGKIIHDAGLCGKEIGGAQVAPWHGNIIINKNHATQTDIRRLMDYIISEVKKQKGIELEPEVIICGK